MCLLRSRILPVAAEAGDELVAGTELLRGELRAGEVVAPADGVGLALLRLDRLGELTAAGAGAVRLLRPEWMPAEALAPAEPG